VEDKKKRFRRLNLIIEFDLFSENFCWPNESQEAGCPAGGLLPEKDRGWAKAGAELIRGESRQVAQGVNAPFVQNRNDVGELFGAVDGAQGCLFGGLIVRHERKLEPEWNMFNRTYFLSMIKQPFTRLDSASVSWCHQAMMNSRSSSRRCGDRLSTRRGRSIPSGRCAGCRH